MVKTVIKEIVIVILLLIAITLTLGIVFYDYIPNNKSIPIKEQPYAFPEDIKEELQENFEGEQNIVKTYYIDSTDLSAYESSKDYEKGKSNPFADYSESTSTESNTTSAGKNTAVSGNTTSGNTNNTDTENKESYSNKPVK